MRLILTALSIAFLSLPALAQEQEATPLTPDAAPPEAPAETLMTMQRLGEILIAVDPEAQLYSNGAELTLFDVPVMIIADPIADRMRAMVPIRSAAGLDAEELMRLMQANFDTALDARYAVAQGRLWGLYMHPLSPLSKEQLLSGLAQTVNVARTYGESYAGGGAIFGGGDSGDIYLDLLEELLKRGEEI